MQLARVEERMQSRLEMAVERMARLEQRAQQAEAGNVRLVEESGALRASLETAHRLSEEKLNGEIRLRSELELDVKTLVMAADRERGKGGRDVEQLQAQVQQLQRVLGEQGENQLRIEDELSVALKADEKGALQRLDAQLAEQGNQAAAERRLLADEQTKLEGGVGRRLEAVQGELLGQAEQVGKELHARSEAISSLQQQLHATEENGAAALAAAQDAIERLAAAQQMAEASLGREREERREAESASEMRLQQAQQLQMEAHEASEQRTAAAMAEVRSTLDARLQAEQGLLKRLQLQHGQQGALEDKGVSVQQTNSLTFDEIRALLLANGAAIAREAEQRQAGEAEARRQLEGEAAARDAALEQAAEVGSQRHAGLERVLRSEIKARMRGEASGVQATQATKLEMQAGQRSIRGDVEELATALGSQLRMAQDEVARLRAHVEEELARAMERQRAANAAHEMAVRALAAQLQQHAEATEGSLAQLGRRAAAELAAQAEAQQAALGGVREEAAEGRQLVAEEAAAQLDEAAEVLQAKLEECDGALAEERAARRAAEEAAAAADEVRACVDAMVSLLEAEEAALNAVVAAQLEAEAREEVEEAVAAVAARAEAAAASLSSELEAQRCDVEALQEEAEAAQQLQMEERAARQEGLTALAEDLKGEMRAEADARVEAQAEEECRAVLEGLVSTVAEEGLMAGLEDAIKGAAGSAAEQAAP